MNDKFDLKKYLPGFLKPFFASPSPKQDFKNLHILITAGGTIEDIDPVRFISNRSSGKMGIALAKAAATRGAQVTLIYSSIQVPLPKSPSIRCIYARSAENMFDEVNANIDNCHIAILTAAVSDFKPQSVAKNKLKKVEGQECPLSKIIWEETPDILAFIGELNFHPYLVGFAAESENVIENARKKLINKHCDMICANDITNTQGGFGSDNNQISIITRNGSKDYPLMNKNFLANMILDEILEEMNK